MKNVIAAFCAIAVSVVAHGVGLSRDQADATELPASAPPRAVALGNNFETLSAGRVGSVQPVAATAVQSSDLPQTVAPTVTPIYAAQEFAAAPEPDMLAPVQPVDEAAAIPDGPRPPLRPSDLRPPAGSGARQTAVAGSQTPTNQRQTTSAVASAQGDDTTAEVASDSRAARNYGNVVMRKISRTRRVTTGLRGRTLVAFAVADTGALASVSVAQSSGNPDLDTIAVDHIRRAAPFDPPPAGAMRNFSVVIEGR